MPALVQGDRLESADSANPNRPAPPAPQPALRSVGLGCVAGVVWEVEA